MQFIDAFIGYSNGTRLEVDLGHLFGWPQVT